MIEREVKITTDQGEMTTYLFSPHQVIPAPVVILFMDAPGIRDELLNMARRITRAGYYCAVPDLYYRIGYIRIDLSRRTEAHAAVYRALSGTLSNEAIARDTANLLAFLAGEPQASQGPVACLGYSVGARFALQAAGLFPNQVGAAITVCGTGLVTDNDDSPHRTLAHGQAELLLDFAEHDPAVGAQVMPTLKEALTRHDRAFELVIEPHTSHGYCFPLRPIYNAVAAENSWQRIFNLLKRTLQPA